MNSHNLSNIETYFSGWKKAVFVGAGCLALILSELNQGQAQIATNSRYETLVNVGDAVPTGGSFNSMSRVVMSNNGQWIGFEGFHTTSGGTDTGIFRHSLAGGIVNRIIADNQVMTNGNFSMVFANRTLAVNDSGTVAFNGNLAGTAGGANDDSGIFSGSGGAITEMVREGNAAPGGSGGTFGGFGTGFDVQFTGINNSGDTFFHDNISDSPGGFSDDSRFFRVGSGAPVTIATEGDPAPGPSFGNYNFFNFPAYNDIGEAVVTGGTVGATVPASSGKLWFVDSSGGMSELAYLSASGGSITPVGAITNLAVNPTINNADDVVFAAWTSSGGIGTSDSHLFHVNKNGGAISVMMSEGDAAPDGNGEFANLVHLVPKLNDAGQYASGFELRNTNGGTADDTGIFRVSKNGNIVQMFREGQAALSGNGTFGAMPGSFTNFAYNNAGNVAMQTTYVGTAGGGLDNVAIVISDGIDSIEVAREGNMVNGQSVVGLSFMNGAYGNNSSTNGLNDFGQIAYYQTTTGGGRSIELWTPELHHRGGTTNFSDGSNWTLSLGPAHVHDVFMDSATNSVVTASGINTVRNLQIGGGAGTAKLQLASSGQLNVIDTLQFDSNGSIEIGANSILNVGTLAGTGFIAGSTSSTLQINDLLNPGMSPGRLEFTGSLILDSGASTMIELGGLGTGQFDQIYSLSGLTVDGLLDVSLFGGFTLANGMSFTIFDIAGTATGATSGQFTGLNEGGLVGNFGGTDLYISYAGGNGNDISLYTTAVPEPSSLAIVALAACSLIRRRDRC